MKPRIASHKLAAQEHNPTAHWQQKAAAAMALSSDLGFAIATAMGSAVEAPTTTFPYPMTAFCYRGCLSCPTGHAWQLKGAMVTFKVY